MHDVVIVGAGPAGSALAMELARDGHSVLLLEGARFPRDKPCGDYLSPRALASLERLGCGPAVRAMGSTPIRSSRLYLGRDQLVCGSLPHVSGLPDHGLAIPRRELDHLIYRRAIEAGAEGREGCRVTGFEVAHDRIEAIGTLDGKPWRGAGRLLIGADGATSSVARAAGLPMNDDRYTMASIRAYATGLCLDHTLMYFNEKYFPGYGWIFPIKPGLCNIGVGMVSEPLIRERLRLGDFYALFVKVVQHLARSRGAAVQIGPRRGWPIRTYGGAAKNYFTRGLLIGEAGCFVDPLNGEGISLALESARIAARTIRTALDEGRFSALDLARYERDWRAAFDPDLGISDFVVALIRNRDLLPLWLHGFRALCHTASKDEAYARVLGGILGGAVRAREGVALHMFARAFAGTSSFWRDGFRSGWRSIPSNLLHQPLELLKWQFGVGRAALAEPERVKGWLREVAVKQVRVATRMPLS